MKAPDTLPPGVYLTPEDRTRIVARLKKIDKSLSRWRPRRLHVRLDFYTEADDDEHLFKQMQLTMLWLMNKPEDRSESPFEWFDCRHDESIRLHWGGQHAQFGKVRIRHRYWQQYGCNWWYRALSIVREWWGRRKWWRASRSA